MTTEHDYLAKVCANIIKSQGLVHEQEILVGAKIIGLLASPSAPTEGASTSSPSKQGALSHKAQEVTPSEPKRPPKVIAKKGLTCSCSSCQKLVYQITRDVTDPMPVSEFIEAFTPLGHDGILSTKTELQNVNGNVSVNCPLCKSPFTVYLIGKQGDGMEFRDD